MRSRRCLHGRSRPSSRSLTKATSRTELRGLFAPCNFASIAQEHGSAVECRKEWSCKTPADATPHAASLIEGLRDIGYSLETAISDIIDNSITAGAPEIGSSRRHSDEPAIAMLDDGVGMTEDELIAAMRPGSQNPLATRSEPDLGRFGLGLKSASFSQCRRLTVVSRKRGQTLRPSGILMTSRNGTNGQCNCRTIVSGIPAARSVGRPREHSFVWQKLDRLIGGVAHNAAKRAEVINRAHGRNRTALRLVFHRFMEDAKRLSILLNGRLLRPLDPFARKNPQTIADPEEVLELTTAMSKYRASRFRITTT